MKILATTATFLMFLCSAAAAQVVIVDNSDTAQTLQVGNWQTSSGAGYYGTDSVYSDTDPATFTFIPVLPEDGALYSVDVRFTYFGNRTQNAQLDLVHMGGTEVRAFDQRDASIAGAWIPIGVYRLDASSTVTWSRAVASSDTLSADAVRFTKEIEPAILRFTYTEPSGNQDGSPLINLESCTITWEINGGVQADIETAASSPAGGGAQSIEIPWPGFDADTLSVENTIAAIGFCTNAGGDVSDVTPTFTLIIPPGGSGVAPGGMQSIGIEVIFN